MADLEWQRGRNEDGLCDHAALERAGQRNAVWTRMRTHHREAEEVDLLPSEVLQDWTG